MDAGPVEPESLSPTSLAPMSDAMAAKSPGEWFVNIGAYASELSAENWSLRLQNSGYDAVVEDVRTEEGKMLKRVRPTGFDSEEAAQSVAIELEADYGTGPLGGTGDQMSKMQKKAMMMIAGRGFSAGLAWAREVTDGESLLFWENE